MFLVEARPDTPNPALHPGLPVEVSLSAACRSERRRGQRSEESRPMTAAIDVQGLTKRYDGRAVVDDFAIKRRARTNLRLPRPERQRQDDDDPDAVRAF